MTRIRTAPPVFCPLAVVFLAVAASDRCPGQALVPKGVTASDGTSAHLWLFPNRVSPFSRPDSHLQCFYATQDVGPAAAFRSLEFRQDASSANPARSVGLTVKIEASTTPHDKHASVFASNLSKPTTVFSGSLNLPSRNASNTWPASWETPVSFSRPIVWTAPAGGSLVVDFVVSSSTSLSFWQIDEALRRTYGSRRVVHAHCGRNTANCSLTGTYLSTTAGQLWGISYDGLPSTVQAGSSVLIAGLSSTTPVPLSKLGILSFGCHLGVSVALILPVTPFLGPGAPPCRGGLHSPRVRIPTTTPSGTKLYTQFLVSDPISSLSMAYTTEVVEWTFASPDVASQINASYLFEWTILSPTTMNYRAPFLRFQ